MLTKPLGTQIAVNAHQWMEQVNSVYNTVMYNDSYYYYWYRLTNGRKWKIWSQEMMVYQLLNMYIINGKP